MIIILDCAPATTTSGVENGHGSIAMHKNLAKTTAKTFWVPKGTIIQLSLNGIISVVDTWVRIVSNSTLK